MWNVPLQPWILGALILALAACGPSEDASPESGVPRWDVTPEPLVSIGERDGEEAYLFSRITDIRLLESGGIAVADEGSKTIRIYEADGSYVRQMGGEGGGPGEFQDLSSMHLAPPDTLVAYDIGGPRVTRFRTTGELVSTRALRGADGFGLYLGSLSGGDVVTAWIFSGGIDPTTLSPDPMRIGRFGSDGELEERLATSPGLRRTDNVVPFSPRFLGVTIGDTVFYSDGLDGSVRAVDARGRTVRTFRVPLEAPDPGVAWSRLEAELDSSRLEQLEEFRQMPGTDSIPVFSEMLRGHDAILWFKRFDPAADSAWLLGSTGFGGDWIVVRTDGEPVARVELPERFRLMDVRDERIAGVHRDELGVERVRVYGLRR